jgi:DNA repair exonuclease SbcCD ATPase subunit
MASMVAGDDAGDVAPDTVWLTYKELAAALEVKVESARRLVQRKRWPRRPGNDGEARIGVPGDIARGYTRDVGRHDGRDIRGVKAEARLDAVPDVADDTTPDIAVGVAPALLALAAQLQDAQALAEERGRELTAAREALARTEGNAEAQATAVTRLERDVEWHRGELSRLAANLAEAEAQIARERHELQAERQRHMEAREVWEARLDGLAADLAQERQARLTEAEAHARREVELQRLQGEMERLRSRPWWRRLFGTG